MGLTHVRTRTFTPISRALTGLGGFADLGTFVTTRTHARRAVENPDGDRAAQVKRRLTARIWTAYSQNHDGLQLSPALE